MSPNDRALIEALISKVSALETQLTLTQQDRKKMNWLKRKLTGFFNSLPPAEYDLNSPFGFGGMV